MRWAELDQARIAELEGALRDIKEAWDEGDVNEQDRIMREVLGDE